MSWLPPRHDREMRLPRLWQPPMFAWLAVGELMYVVVDEIEGSAAGLAVCEWPRVDEAGRLRFTSGALLLGADVRTMEGFLARHRRPRELAERPLRVGDVFAVRVRSGALESVRDELAQPRRLEPFLGPADWIDPPVYDVSADAREAAKTSYYAAVTPTLEPAQAMRLRDIMESAPSPVALRPGLLGRSLNLLPHLRPLLSGAVLLALGLGGGTAVGRASAPTTTVARETIIHSQTISVTRPGSTVTKEGATIIRTVTEPRETVTEPGRTVTDAGATVTEAGATVTEPGTTVTQKLTETVTTSTTVVQRVPSRYTLRVVIAEGEGSVISTPRGIACRNDGSGVNDCTASFPYKTRVLLLARPSQQCSFKSLTTSVGTCVRNRCQIVQADSIKVEARFSCVE